MKVLFLNHNNILTDVIPHFEVTTEIAKADRVVVWSDIPLFERRVVQIAKAHGIPTIVVQHGRRGSSRYYPPFEEKILADKLLVWGEADRKGLIEAGQDPDKIKVVGTTIFSHLKPRVQYGIGSPGNKVKEHLSVVFCPEHWDRPVEENLWVRDELRKVKDFFYKVVKVKITTKIIDSPSHQGVEWDNPIMSYRGESGHLPICAEVLSTADIVVGVSESTFELLAQSLDIPVVIMSEWTPKSFGGDERYVNYRRVVSNAVKQADRNNVAEVTAEHLHRGNLNNHLCELREERRRVCIEEGGFGLDSLELIKREIWTR